MEIYLTGFIIMFLFVIKHAISVDNRKNIDGGIMGVDWGGSLMAGFTMALVWPLSLIAVIADIIRDARRR